MFIYFTWIFLASYRHYECANCVIVGGSEQEIDEVSSNPVESVTFTFVQKYGKIWMQQFTLNYRLNSKDKLGYVGVVGNQCKRWCLNSSSAS